MEEPHIITGGISKDERGSVSFVNDFNFKDIKRFYIVSNKDVKTNRGWHGHMKEAKYVLVPHGKTVIKAVALDHTEHPSKKNKIHSFILSSENPGIVYIPKGYANGMQILEPDTQVIFFSTKNLEESKDDDFRFPYDYWGTKTWNTKDI